MSDDTPELRASDAERRHTAEVLERALSEGRLDVAEFEERVSAAWGARHTTELVRLTSDLPVTASPGADLAAAHGHPSRVTADGGGPSTTIAVMSGNDRHGEWTVPREHTALAVMGGVELDLREARLSAAVTHITAVAVMGGVDIVLPADVRLEVSGFGLMGGFGEGRDAGAPAPPAPAGAPLVRVTGFALMGGVNVTRTARRPGIH